VLEVFLAFLCCVVAKGTQHQNQQTNHNSRSPLSSAVNNSSPTPSPLAGDDYQQLGDVSDVDGQLHDRQPAVLAEACQYFTLKTSNVSRYSVDTQVSVANPKYDGWWVHSITLDTDGPGGGLLIGNLRQAPAGYID
jgi:hypothetical protein